IVSVNDLPGTTTIHSIAIGRDGYVLAGNPITLNGGITCSGITEFLAIEIALDIKLGAPQTFTVDAGLGLGIEGVVSGDSAALLTVYGNGAVALYGDNTYAGGTKLIQGQLFV